MKAYQFFTKMEDDVDWTPSPEITSVIKRHIRELIKQAGSEELFSESEVTLIARIFDLECEGELTVEEACTLLNISYEYANSIINRAYKALPRSIIKEINSC